MRFFALLLAFMTALPAMAQDRANTILVLDGSGSMWGQIDGVNKIVIARDVVSTILGDFPADENLGLTVYGHRTRGDCTDIETVVAPGAGTTDAIRDAVNAINPRGKTPMTDAVIAAAEALRYTEEAATVILVSDGIETCNPDPCAAARALEQAGIDFTAHVVGFDVTDPEALAQMQCLAGETGGTFTTAANAEELTRALETVAVAEPEPEMIVVPVTFRAELEDGTLITSPVFWDIASDSGVVTQGQDANPLELELLEGSHVATAYWAETETEQSAQFVVVQDPREVVLVFEAPLPGATVTGPLTAPAGSTIEVGWTGPGADDDFISVDRPDNDRWINYTYVEKGNPVELLLPAYPGDYELRYMLEGSYDILATQAITVTEVEASLDTPPSANAGATIEVGWTGPDYDNDFIAVEAPDGDRWINYAYTEDGNPAELVMPTEPGTYEIRYVMNQDYRVLAATTIEVTDVAATLTAPDTAVAGATVEVGWTGPDYDNDFIAVETPDGDRWINYAYTEDGDPAELVMPAEPGIYEIRYVLNQGYEVLASHRIEVTEVQASLVAPDEAPAGATVEVAWEGPDYDNDFIAVETPDGDRWINYEYTKNGSPVDLVMPAEPGTYEIRYVASQDYTVLASHTITLTAVGATIAGPTEAMAGATIEVSWTGPDYQNDLIVVEAPDGDRWINYTYAKDGSPLELLLPVEPGDYELRYVMAQDREVLASQPITVLPVKADLLAPETAPMGAHVEIGWDGPDYPNDYIGISEPGEANTVTYEYTNRGNPARVEMPATPGTYEVRYYLSQGRTVIGTRDIEVTKVEAQLLAEGTAEAGGTLTVGWDGPDYDGDYIAIFPAGDDRYATYEYTNRGNPAEIDVPDTPGAYEIRYVLRQGRTEIGSVPLTVE